MELMRLLVKVIADSYIVAALNAIETTVIV